MKAPFLSLLIVLIIGFLACQPSESQSGDTNPAAPGFNTEESDASAVAIADEVMLAMGGRKAWDETRYIKWTFFGRRTLTWDKKEKKCRIEVPGEDLTILVNLDDVSGKVKKGSEEFTQQDSLAKYLQMGKEIWINDSYWLVMPFKLKDSGVTLKSMGVDTMQGGIDADVLELTFREVGVTPDNRYLVYVDKENRLVSQWDFYTTYQDTVPRFSTPWAEYEEHGSILLSGNRGRGSLTDIAVLEELPASVFTEF